MTTDAALEAHHVLGNLMPVAGVDAARARQTVAALEGTVNKRRTLPALPAGKTETVQCTHEPPRPGVVRVSLHVALSGGAETGAQLRVAGQPSHGARERARVAGRHDQAVV